MAMNTDASDVKFDVQESPLAATLVDELIEFWTRIFDIDYDAWRAVLRGDEREHNRDLIYQARHDCKLVGTCHLTIPVSDATLGGLGEVGTDPAFRRMGIAQSLCEWARDEFSELDGVALYLGTGNPDAARVYHRLGWRKLAGANVMALTTDRSSPEAFAEGHFRPGGGVTVTPGSPADRVAVIPLIVCPHDWQILDANTQLISTRYVDQSSCMGLYPRYEALARDGRGAWFAAHTEWGRTVGLSTARIDDAGDGQVDGFVHDSSANAWDALMAAAIAWARDQGVSTCRLRASREDEQKIDRCEAIGFKQVGRDEPFELRQRSVPAVRLEQHLS